MGCDIHFSVEKKTADGWVRAEPVVKNKYASFDEEPELVSQDFYGDRNYNLFAMLADVRNGRGFGGVDTGNRVEPISAPRGLPEDVGADVKARSDSYDCDGHSHSWLSLAELLATPWDDNKITHRGWVEPRTFHRFDKWGSPPQSYSGSVFGGNVRHVSNDELRKLIEDGTVDPNAETDWSKPHYYTTVEWTTSWMDSIGGFSETLVRMTAVAANEGLGFEDVRAVFFFDN